MSDSNTVVLDIVFGIAWGLVITLICLSPNVFTDSIEFVYANF